MWPDVGQRETVSMQCNSHIDGGEENLRGGEVVRLMTSTGHGRDILTLSAWGFYFS